MPASLLLTVPCRGLVGLRCSLAGVLAAILVSGGPIASAQGPDTGSPFVDAPLPFDALKAAPASAFEVLMISIAVFLLVAMVGAAFLALARLRSMEEGLTQELRLLREEGEPDPSGLSVEDAAARFEAALNEMRSSIERCAERAHEASESSSSVDLAGIAELLERTVAVQAKASHETIERIDALASALREALAESQAGAAGRAPTGPSAETGDESETGEDRLATTLDRVHTRMAALGFTEVEIITPRVEITRELQRSGALVVEARRSGAVHKGKVTLENGAVVDVQLKTGHDMFP